MVQGQIAAYQKLLDQYQQTTHATHFLFSDN